MEKKRFLQIYLVLVIIFGLLGLVDNLLGVEGTAPKVYSYLMLLLTLLFFLFNILAIAIFHHDRVQRLAYVLPIYHIITFVLFTGMSTVLVKWISELWMGLIGLGFLTSLFEILFGFYVLAKVKSL